MDSVEPTREYRCDHVRVRLPDGWTIPGWDARFAGWLFGPPDAPWGCVVRAGWWDRVRPLAERAEGLRDEVGAHLHAGLFTGEVRTPEVTRAPEQVLIVATGQRLADTALVPYGLAVAERYTDAGQVVRIEVIAQHGMAAGALEAAARARLADLDVLDIPAPDEVPWARGVAPSGPAEGDDPMPPVPCVYYVPPERFLPELHELEGTAPPVVLSPEGEALAAAIARERPARARAAAVEAPRRPSLLLYACAVAPAVGVLLPWVESPFGRGDRYFIWYGPSLSGVRLLPERPELALLPLYAALATWSVRAWRADPLGRGHPWLHRLGPVLLAGVVLWSLVPGVAVGARPSIGPLGVLVACAVQLLEGWTFRARRGGSGAPEGRAVTPMPDP